MALLAGGKAEAVTVHKHASLSRAHLAIYGRSLYFLVAYNWLVSMEAMQVRLDVAFLDSALGWACSQHGHKCLGIL